MAKLEQKREALAAKAELLHKLDKEIVELDYPGRSSALFAPHQAPEVVTQEIWWGSHKVDHLLGYF